MMETQPYERIPPVQDYLGITIEQREPHAVVSLELTDQVSGWGPVHGGVLALLADVTCAVAVAGALDTTVELPATSDMHVRYIAQPKASPLRSEGRVVHRRSKAVIAECVIRDGHDREIVRTTASYRVFEIPGRSDLIRDVELRDDAS